MTIVEHHHVQPVIFHDVSPSSGETILTPAISGLLSAEIKATTKFLNKINGLMETQYKILITHRETFIVNFKSVCSYKVRIEIFASATASLLASCCKGIKK
jgi:hypothetical protein